jgi:hypothetical protein
VYAVSSNEDQSSSICYHFAMQVMIIPTSTQLVLFVWVLLNLETTILREIASSLKLTP